MKVAIIEPVGGHGGMNYYDFALCLGLTISGVEVTLYTCDETEVPNNLAFTVKQHFQRIYGNGSRHVRAVRYLLGLIDSLTDAYKLEVKLVHFHFFHTSLLEWFSVKLAKLFGFKVVITAHDIESFAKDSSQGMARAVYYACDLIIVHNQVSFKELNTRLRVTQAKIRVIAHGNYIDFINTHVSQQQARERLMLAGEGPFLLFFGQIKEVKGLDILINALPEVIKKFPLIKLIVAGKVWKDDFSKYQALVEKHKLSSNINFHIHYIPDELLSYYYQASNLVVLPYRKIYQSGVLLMAMSFGCPVLVSDLEGMIEVVQDNLNGFTFRQGDSHHLAQRLITILSDSRMTQGVAKAGYATVCNHYGWTQISHQTSQVYSEIIPNLSKM